MKAVSYLAARLSEATTYAALAAVLAGAGVKIPPGVWQDVTFAGMAAAALAAVVIKEGWRAALTSGDAVKAVEAVSAEVKS